MSAVRAHYHPFLFLLMTLSALAELGLTAFLISAGNEHHTWPSPRYHSLLILFLFNAVWTTIFSTAYMLWIVDGAIHMLASVASSIIWLLVSSVLWGTAAGVMHNTRSGGNCAGFATISRFVRDRLPYHAGPELSTLIFRRCRQSLTVEALGWTEFAICIVTLTATCLWVRSGKRSYVSDLRRLV